MPEKPKNRFGLIDLIIWHQFIVESYKLWLGLQFQPFADELAEDLIKIMGKIEAEKLSEIRKRDMDKIIAEVNRTSTAIFNKYGKYVGRKFHTYGTQEQKLIQGEFNFILGHKPPIAAGRVNAVAFNAPLSANGKLPGLMLAEFMNKTKAEISARLRQAYANGEAPREALRAVIGTAPYASTKGTLLHKAKIQHNALTNTILQHITGTAAELAGRQHASCYIWISVIDDVTTDICRSLDGQVFKYGDGPVPPAHYNCRSSTEPWGCDGEALVDDRDTPQSSDRTPQGWVDAQDAEMLKEVFGSVKINLLENDNLSFQYLGGRIKPHDLAWANSMAGRAKR